MNKGYAGLTRSSIANSLRKYRSNQRIPELVAVLRSEGRSIAKELGAKPHHFEADHTRFICPDGPFCQEHLQASIERQQNLPIPS